MIVPSNKTKIQLFMRHSKLEGNRTGKLNTAGVYCCQNTLNGIQDESLANQTTK